ncbi:MAG: HAD family phosphatase [Chloroflexota bacterium]
MKWLLCDYGEVLSRAQPDDDRAALLAVSGRDSAGFWEAYWGYRPAYDRGDTSASEYWESVLGGRIENGRLQELKELDVASWLHPNEASLEAAHRVSKRGYGLAILSNAPVELADVLDRTSWLRDFEPRLYSCRLRVCKPDADVYRMVLDCLHAQPNDVIFFDDRQANITGALDAGIRAHLFTDPSQIDDVPGL